MVLFELIKSFIWGIIQGVTEWLPISSTGHLLLFNSFWPFQNTSEEFFNMFKVVIQLGSILAVIVLFFHKLNPFSPKKTPKRKRETYSLWGKVLIASIPAAIIGLLLDDIIDDVLSRPWVIAGALIFYGILFIILESRKRKPLYNDFKEISWKTALFIGAFQTLALIPGTSRSGATILGAVFLGTSRYIAAEFSFFMAIPAMFGASGLKLMKYLMNGTAFTGEEWGIFIIGTVVSFVVSLFVIRFLINFVKKHDFKIFGYYRIALGIVVMILLLLNVIQNTPV